MWHVSLRSALGGFALATIFVVSNAPAAQLIPVTFDTSGQFASVGAAGHISNAMLYDRGDSVVGESGNWPLGEFRMAIETAAATMTATIDQQSVQMSTGAALRDAVPGDLSAPEANPQIGDTWFYVAPSQGQAMGVPVDLFLSLAWDSVKTGGAIADSTATAVLSNADNPRVAPALTNKRDSEVAEVMTGEFYRVGLYHDNLVRDGLLVSAATLYAGLAPAPVLAAPEPTLPGDYNLDGTVNAADYTVWRDGLAGPYDFNLDGDGSGTIDDGDRQVISDWYGSTVPGVSAVAIPEPTSVMLFATSLLACGLKMSRWR